MRATNGLQTTITLDPVNSDGQAFSVDLLLEVALPMPPQDERLPDQIEAYVHQAGLEMQRKLYQVLIEKADKELVLQQRHGKGGAGIQRRGTRPHTFKTIPARRDDCEAVADLPPSRWHDGGAVGDRLEHVPPTHHHPESPRCGL